MYSLKNLERIEKTFNSLFFRTPFEVLTKNLIETNMIEDEESYGIEYIVPGFKKEELSVIIEGKQLIVEGKRNGQEIKSNRTIYFPNGVKSVTAKLENGILTVSVPKEKTKKDKIVVDIK